MDIYKLNIYMTFFTNFILFSHFPLNFLLILISQKLRIELKLSHLFIKQFFFVVVEPQILQQFHFVNF